jgi:hypothetical protein
MVIYAIELVGVRGLEPRTSWSQTMRATNCATPRQKPVLSTSVALCCTVLYAHYSMIIVMCQALLVFSSLVTPFEQEEIPARREAAQGIATDGLDITRA